MRDRSLAPRVGFLRKLAADVLVVGGGATAARAAIAAAEAGADTILATKGLLGKSGNSPMAPFSLCAAIGDGDSEDSPAVHYADTMKGGSYLNEPSLARALAEDAPRAVRDLEGFGLRFDRRGDGLDLAPMPGHSRDRACHVDMHTGQQMMYTLARLARRVGVRVIEDHVALRVLLDCGTAVGATLLDVAAGGVVVVAASAVVLATGGLGSLFSVSSNSVESTGDGYALGLRAGAGLIDMEMVQYHPCGLLRPATLRGVTTPPGTMMGHGGHFVNALGERFMARYDPINADNTTRAMASQAIFMEIQAGRGTPLGGVFMDARHLPEEYLRSQHPGQYWFEYLLSLGLDIRREMMEIAPAVHHMMGGIAINHRCETDVPGLFAAGECSGGVHGANRLGGNALAETQVFGARAGRSAAKYAAEVSASSALHGAAEADLHLIDELISREPSRGGAGLRAWEAKERLQEIMSRSAGVCRSGEGIAEGLAGLEELAGLLRREMVVANRSLPYNSDLVEALEVGNMVLVAEAILRSAGRRRESRGAHFRVDYSESVEPCLNHVGVHLDPGGRVIVGDRPIGRREVSSRE